MSNGHASDFPNLPNGRDVLPSDIPNAPPPSGDENTPWSTQPASDTSSVLSSFLAGTAPPQPPLWSGPKRHSSNKLLSIVEECREQCNRGSPVNWGLFGAVLDAVKHQDDIDDRKLLLENILVFLSRLPDRYAGIGTRVEHFLIDLLYKDLPHPPSTFLGPLMPSTSSTSNILGLKGFAYREPDGSSNNPLIPRLGAAHEPYARSVASSHVSPVSTLPDPAVVFDMLLRRDKKVKHPTGLSSLFFAFANLIIHSLFRTNPQDWSINDTSSYLDLSSLYGVDKDEQDGVRNRDGTGQMWNDVFADRRLLAMPPSVGALLIIFNRNHNFIANRILAINERGTFESNFLPENKAKQDAQDDEIFNRAKLVNCGTFMQVIMRDYVGSILRMIPDLSPWHLKPLEAIRDSKHEFTPRGEGNVCSVEFNLLYRWHATTSSADEKWLQESWEKSFGKKSYDDVTPKEFGDTVRNMLRPDKQVKKWTFGGLKRDEHTGRFDDGAIANILQNATEEAASAFKARGTPAVFKVIEMIGIQQARTWGVCGLNEFRSFLGLKRYSSFKEWNPDPEICRIAEQLYHDIDNLELYVGMQAEETRPTIPGSGLCSGYTMSRSILADAVALIRGDRFLTIEYTPFNLTSWGFRDAETDDDNGSLGGMLTKLLFRTLPRHYTPGSIYAHFPLMVPHRMFEFLGEKKSMQREYTHSRPRPSPVTQMVNSFEAVKEVVKDWSRFGSLYTASAESLTDGYGFFVGSTKHERDRAMVHQALFNPVALKDHAQFYHEKTRELIADHSFAPVGGSTKTVDIVRQVLNFVPVHWAATRVAGLPLKTKNNPEGTITEHELYGYLAVLFNYVYLNSEPVNDWFLKHHSRNAAALLLGDINCQVEKITAFTFRGFLNYIRGDEDEEGERFIRQLADKHTDCDSTNLAHIILGVIVNSAANWSHAMTHVVNFYLDSERKRDKDAIVSLACRPINEESERLLIGYAKEALRLDPPVAGVFREVCADVEVQDTHLQKGERVIADLASAIVDENHVGPDALVVNPNRDHTKYNLSFVVGAHTSVDETFSDKTMAHVLRAVFSQKNLRRANGLSGRLTRFTEEVHGVRQTLYIDSNGQVTRWPQSLLVQFDM